MVAVPVRSLGPVLHDVCLALDANAVVTDAGSTKADAMRTARDELRERYPRFVAGHPIAGRETSGVEAASAELFRGARVVLTPDAETLPEAVDMVRGAWEATGARVATMAGDLHDRIFAAVSHLPHVLSFALVSELAEREDAQQLFGFAAGGFRDFTRIAASSPEMWRDIALANRHALMTEIAAYRKQLDRISALVADADGAGLEALFGTARAARRAWDARRNAAGGRVPEDGPREP
jgi:prephenate dehydrogenase